MSASTRLPDRLTGMLEGIQLALLGLWFGALVMVAATAAIAFPAMRDLEPSLPGYESYPSGHWEIAAGHIMAPAFAFGDGVQVFCCAGVGLCLAILIGTRRVDLARPANLFRLIIVVVLIGVLIEYLTRVAMPMQSMLREFWQHAMEGRVDQADAVRESFDVLHPKSSARLGAMMIGLGVAMLATIASLGSSFRRRDTG